MITITTSGRSLVCSWIGLTQTAGYTIFNYTEVRDHYDAREGGFNPANTQKMRLGQRATVWDCHPRRAQHSSAPLQTSSAEGIIPHFPEDSQLEIPKAPGQQSCYCSCAALSKVKFRSEVPNLHEEGPPFISASIKLDVCLTLLPAVSHHTHKHKGNGVLFILF